MTASEYIANVIAANEVSKHTPHAKQAWIDTLYLANIHLQGIKPRYRNLRLYSDAASYESYGTGKRFSSEWITPTGWQPKYQPYFEQLILNRYPTVREERFHWQCSIYPSFAQSLFLQAIDEIRGAIFQDTNFGYDFVNEITANYILEKRFDGLDFYDYVTNILVLQIISDPNGYAVTMPAWWDSETGEMGEPTIRYVSSESILYVSETLLVWQYGGFLYMADSTDFYRMAYNKKNRKYDLANIEILPHTLQAVPFTVLGGYKMFSPDLGSYYLSFFNGALDWANVAIRQFIDTEALNKDIVPITQMVQIECATCHGTGSVPVECPEDANFGGCTETCNKCSGKGHISRNMGDVISVDPNEIRDGKLPQYLQYITGDVSNLKYSDERFAQMYDRFLEALYLKFIDEAQSGVAKAMDREKLYKFLSGFSDNIFDVVTDCLVRLDAILNTTAADVNMVSIKRPTQFVLKSEGDLRDELRQLISANAPDTAIKAVSDTLTMLAVESPVTEKKIKFLSLYDPLRYKSDTQKAMLVNVAGAFTKQDLIRSMRAENELNRLIELKTVDWFMMASIDEITRLIDEALQPYLDAVPVLPPLMP